MAGDGIGRTRSIGVGLAAGALVLAGSVALAHAGLSPRLLRTPIELAHPGVRWIDASELERALDGARPPTLIDARSADEIAVSRIRGAQPFDPAGRGDFDGPVVVYCSVGWRSARAAEQLARAGVRDVRSLAGGIFGWTNEGRPVYRGERPVAEVHPYDRLWAVFLDDELEAHVPREESP